jgi:uncharacterized protein (TIGR02453 family)
MNFPIIFKFLKSLSKNNDRDWFEKHKGEYLEAKEQFDLFVADLLKEMISFEPVRFSKDKRPYKTNMGATFSTGGKQMAKPGYYFHLEPGGKSFVAGGLYMPAPEDVQKIRQEIDYNSAALEKIFSNARFKKLYKSFDDFDKLKTAPKGFPKDHPQVEWLKLKSFIVSHYFTDEEVSGNTFLKNVTSAFQTLKPLNDFLGDAIA